MPLQESADRRSPSLKETDGRGKEKEGRGKEKETVLCESLSSINLDNRPKSAGKLSESAGKENFGKIDDSFGRDIVRQLGEISNQMETLTQTVIFMEKRLSLVEDQVKLLSESKK